MNLRSLHYFLIAAEEMNFTKAAERLFISQQALSSHIKRLEDEYGVRLFERRPALHLTLEGEEMQFYARQILADEMRMRTVFSDIRESCRGKLKIGISRLRASAFSRRYGVFIIRPTQTYPSSLSVTTAQSSMTCCYPEKSICILELMFLLTPIRNALS